MERYLNHMCKIFEVMLLIMLKQDWRSEEDIKKIMSELKK